MIKKFLNRHRGFSLVELMMSAVIIGIIVSLALPNYFAARERSMRTAVKTNMHLVQTMVELYSLDWGGTYPDDRATLFKVANTGNYWVDFKNPETQITDPVADISSFTSVNAIPRYSVLYGGVKSAPNAFVGSVYTGVKEYSTYVIYGTNKDNAPIRHNGIVFSYSNN